MTRTQARVAASLAVAIASILLSSCNKPVDGGTVPQDQIVARIGDDVVSKSEFENELRSSNVPADRQTDPAAMKRVLSDLVLRKFLAQKARQSHLDQEPSLVMNLKRTQEQILANAMMGKLFAYKPPLEIDVAKYIKDNPAHFAERQMLIKEQISFEVGANSQTLIDASKSAQSLDEIDARLTVYGVPHSRWVVMLESNDLPDDIKDTLQSRGDSEVVFVRSGNKASYITAHKARYPLEGDAAAMIAKKALGNEQLKADIATAQDAAAAATQYEGQYIALMNVKVPAAAH